MKLIGATAHYDATDLDEGPIIEQSLQSVDHTHSLELFVSIGLVKQNLALARTVKLHTEHRAFLDGNKKVIFR